MYVDIHLHTHVSMHTHIHTWEIKKTQQVSSTGSSIHDVSMLQPGLTECKGAAECSVLQAFSWWQKQTDFG